MCAAPPSRLAACRQIAQYLSALLPAGRHHGEHAADEPAPSRGVGPVAGLPPADGMAECPRGLVVRRLDPLDCRERVPGRLGGHQLPAHPGRGRAPTGGPAARQRTDLGPDPPGRTVGTRGGSSRSAASPRPRDRPRHRVVGCPWSRSCRNNRYPIPWRSTAWPPGIPVPDGHSNLPHPRSGPLDSRTKLTGDWFGVRGGPGRSPGTSRPPLRRPWPHRRPERPAGAEDDRCGRRTRRTRLRPAPRYSGRGERHRTQWARPGG